MTQRSELHEAGSVFTPEEIEAGRKLFASEWRFVAAAGAIRALPAPEGTEIAFAGRSNVGKSSLINALTGRRALARTSQRPGRTQELVFFAGRGSLRLVDLPGYGYAATSKQKVAAWTELTRTYLADRSNLARVYVLIDARRDLTEADEILLAMLDAAAVSYQTVLTKTDHLDAAGVRSAVAALRGAIERRPAAFPDVGATSALSGAGIPELRAAIARLTAERERARPQPDLTVR
jgi:GTP-binding protein